TLKLASERGFYKTLIDGIGQLNREVFEIKGFYYLFWTFWDGMKQDNGAATGLDYLC
ncbi:MAG: hypothetical protein ACJAS1_002892, partial [Oleiphilaceae bacterium]